MATELDRELEALEGAAAEIVAIFFGDQEKGNTDHDTTGIPDGEHCSEYEKAR